MSDKIWYDVKSHEETHQVTRCGRVRVKDRQVIRSRKYNGIWKKSVYLKRGHDLKPSLTGDGYFQITLDNTTFKVHRWVAETFIPNPDNKSQVNHINGIKTDNRVENLEWCTPRENVKHSYRTGLACNKGERHPRSKLTDSLVREFRERCEAGEKITQIAREYNLHHSTVQKAVRGNHWRHIK